MQLTYFVESIIHANMCMWLIAVWVRKDVSVNDYWSPSMIANEVSVVGRLKSIKIIVEISHLFIFIASKPSSSFF